MSVVVDPPAEHLASLALVRELLPGVVHDIMTPLGVAKGHMQVLLRDHPELAQALGEADTALAHVHRVTRALLAVCCERPEKRRRVEVGSVLTDALAIGRPALRAANAEALLDAQDVPPVLAMRTQLVRVVLNLVVNAAHAMALPREHGHVLHVRALRDGPSVVVELNDTGSGMTPEVLGQAFDPGFTTKGERGTGLGLPTCRSIVQAFGGELVLVSEVGVGTTARLVLPAAEEGHPA
jgi:signal transduction histidine kinase